MAIGRAYYSLKEVSDTIPNIFFQPPLAQQGKEKKHIGLTGFKPIQLDKTGSAYSIELLTHNRL